MKKLLPLSVGLCLLICVPGCDKSSNTTTATSSNKSSSKKHKLAFVTNTTNVFWAAVRSGCINAARNLDDVDLDFRFFTGSTVAEQEAVVNNLVAAGVDGIAISPIDAGKQSEFLSGIAAKTLLVCVDSDAPNSKRAGFIGSDNVAAGKQAANLLKAALPEGGKIVLCVGYTNAQNAIDRIQAIQTELAGGKIEIVATLADSTNPDTAQKNAADALAKYPDLAALVGIYSYNGPAILSAVRAAGKTGKVKIVCFDDDTTTLDGVASGDIHGTVIQVTARIGYETISRMDKHLHGDTNRLAQGTYLFKTIAVDKGSVESVQVYRQNLLEP